MTQQLIKNLFFTTHANPVLGDVSERYNVAVLMPPIARSIRWMPRMETLETAISSTARRGSSGAVASASTPVGARTTLGCFGAAG